MHVSLSSRTLAATLDDEPQIIFLPDGELSRFTLSFESLDKKQRFHVTSQGSVPVVVENDD
jgi:general secretion pathway protein H